MNRRVRSFPVIPVVLAVLTLLSAAAPVRALQVPGNAESRALGIDPELRAGAPLVFLFPQQAVLQPRQVLVFDTSDYTGQQGLGGILAFGKHRLFFFSNRESLSNSTVSTMHGGWAGQLGPVRVGLAGGGYLVKESETEEVLYWYSSGSDFQYSFYAADGNSRSVEGIVGLGIGTGRSFVDLGVESRRETSDRGTATLQAQPNRSDTTIVTFEGDRRPFTSFHARMGLPVGPMADLVVAGQWGGRDRRWKGTFRGIVLGDDLFRREELRGWQDAWRAAAAVAFPLGRADRVTASAAWTSQKLPQYLAGNGEVRHTGNSRREGALAVSVEEIVWREITLRAGLRRSYTRTRVETQVVDAPSSVRYSLDMNEGMNHAFFWGGGWSHGPFRVSALFSANLALNRPFESLDLAYCF